ncbi:serine-rich adhesin for platelets-like [Condylostylus longicornis]|uniref:serine-rich adhesin for platelets-like n=1 Tax=Condylostylus longicornis TaxID=2530218 RepID=UPI00244E036A|nr:serine-rich adhesin for platelets-like [Condylostylus longicornis]
MGATKKPLPTKVRKNAAPKSAPSETLESVTSTTESSSTSKDVSIKNITSATTTSTTAASATEGENVAVSGNDTTDIISGGVTSGENDNNDNKQQSALDGSNNKNIESVSSRIIKKKQTTKKVPSTLKSGIPKISKSEKSNTNDNKNESHEIVESLITDTVTNSVITTSICDGSGSSNINKNIDNVNNSTNTAVSTNLVNAAVETTITTTSSTSTTSTLSGSTKAAITLTTTSQEKLPLVDNKTKALDKMLKSLDIKISGFKDIIPTKAGLVAGGSISENVKTKYRAAKISLGPFSFQRAFSSYKKPRENVKKPIKKTTNQSQDLTEKSNDNTKADTSQTDSKKQDTLCTNTQEQKSQNEDKVETNTAQKKLSTSPKKSPARKQKVKGTEEKLVSGTELNNTGEKLVEDDDQLLRDSINAVETSVEDKSVNCKNDPESDSKLSSQNKGTTENLAKTKEKMKRSKLGSISTGKKVTKKKLTKAHLAEDGGSTTADTGYSSFVSSKSDTQSEAAQSIDLSAKSVCNMDSAKMHQEENDEPKTKAKKGRPRKDVSGKLVAKSRDLSKTTKIKKQLTKIKEKITEIVTSKSTTKENSVHETDKVMSLQSTATGDQHSVTDTSERSSIHNTLTEHSNPADILHSATKCDDIQVKKNLDEPQTFNPTTSTTSNILMHVDMLSDESDSEAVVKAYISEIIKNVDDSEGKNSDECPSPKKNSPLILFSDKKEEKDTQITKLSQETTAKQADSPKKNDNRPLNTPTSTTCTNNKPKMITVRERLQQKYVTAFKFNSMTLPKKKDPAKISAATQRGKKSKVTQESSTQQQKIETVPAKKSTVADIYDFKTESEDEENIKMNLLNESSLKIKAPSPENPKLTKDDEDDESQDRDGLKSKSNRESSDSDNKPLKSTPKNSANNTPIKQQKVTKTESSTDKAAGKTLIKKFAKPSKLASKSNLTNRTLKGSVTKAKAKKGKSKWFIEVSNTESDSDEDGTQKSKKKIVLMPKRRMASLNALAKVQCLYENESRTSNELGLSKTMQIPKIRTIASASSSDEEKEIEKKAAAAAAAASAMALTSSAKLKDGSKENEKEIKKSKDDKDSKESKDHKDKDKEKSDSKSQKTGKDAPKKSESNKETNKKCDVKEQNSKKTDTKEHASKAKTTESTSVKKTESLKKEKPVVKIKSEDESEKSEEEIEVKRELRNVPGLRGVGKHWDFNESFESANESDISFYRYDGDHKPKNKRKKLKLKQKLQKIKREKLAKATKPKLAQFKTRKLIKKKITKLVKASTTKTPKIQKTKIKKSKPQQNTSKQQIPQKQSPDRELVPQQQQHKSIASDSETSDDDLTEKKIKKETLASMADEASAIKNKKKLPFKKRKLIKHDDYLSTLKGLARKRMASLNASALVAATYELEGHLDKNLEELDCYEVIEEKPAILTPKRLKDNIKKDVNSPIPTNVQTSTTKTSTTPTKDVTTSIIDKEDKEPKDMDIEENYNIPTQTNKEKSSLKDGLKDDKDDKDADSIESLKDLKDNNSKDGSCSKDSLKDQSTSRPTSSSVVIVQDTDVTITGVYVNSTTGSSQEAYCKMQYRVQSSVTEERVVSNIENNNVPPKSYTPLGALSNMRPPGTNEGQGTNLIPSNPTASQAQASSTQISSTSEQHSSTALSIYPQPPTQQPVGPASVSSAAAAVLSHHHQHHHHHHHHHGELNPLQHPNNLMSVVPIEETSPGGTIYAHQPQSQNSATQQQQQPPPPPAPPQLSAAQHLSHYGMPPPSLHHSQYDPSQQYQYSTGLSGPTHHYQHPSAGGPGPPPPPQPIIHHPHYGPPIPPPPPPPQLSSTSSQSQNIVRCDSPTSLQQQQQQQQVQQQYHNNLYQPSPPGGPPSSNLSSTSMGSSQSAFCPPNVQQSHQDLSGK